jgi:riboflavin kinase
MDSTLSRIEFEALKEIKKLCGSSGSAVVSSIKLGKILGISQQSASRILISLGKENMITRIMENRKQRIKLTEKGMDILITELNDLMGILNPKDTIDIKGVVTSGLGEGRYYISRKFYIIQFQEKLKFIPYLGTLNIKIKPNEDVHLSMLKNSPGIHIDGFTTEDRSFGPVKAFMCKISGVECAVLMPERTIHTDTMELISEHYLREKLDLKDGDEVTVKVYLF